MKNNDCIFCKIVSGEIPSFKVYEDENTFAFLNINPSSNGHTLVIPKNHAENIMTIESADFSHLMETVRLLSSKIEKAVSANGINININNREAAGQSVFHSHVHIIPRYVDDSLAIWGPKDELKVDIEKYTELVKREIEN